MRNGDWLAITRAIAIAPDQPVRRTVSAPRQLGSMDPSTEAMSSTIVITKQYLQWQSSKQTHPRIPAPLPSQPCCANQYLNLNPGLFPLITVFFPWSIEWPVGRTNAVLACSRHAFWNVQDLKWGLNPRIWTVVLVVKPVRAVMKSLQFAVWLLTREHREPFVVPETV